MGKRPSWWDAWQQAESAAQVQGLVRVKDYKKDGRPAEEVAILEKAAEYEADAVFFEVEQLGRRAEAQAFIYGVNTLSNDQDFAERHRKLWSWGGVPLVYRRTPGLLQLFRCAHEPDFLDSDGGLKCAPVSQLKLAAQIELEIEVDPIASVDETQPWWDEDRIRSGTLWTDPKTCEKLLSAGKAAHKSLFDQIKRLSSDLDSAHILPARLRRRLLILSLLIAYMEQRGVFERGFFARFLPQAEHFFEVLSNGPALVKLLSALEDRFNGKVFALQSSERETLLTSQKLERFAKLIEARENQAGQLSLWELYSFKDLPVELISQIYQLFVENADSSVYTPPFLVRFLVEEALGWETLDHIVQNKQVVLDPCCGSGVFLVEAYKRLVLHWRMRNQWQRPNKQVLQGLLKFVHGVDMEADAVELASFSLCLAMCDALLPEQIRSSIKLFPNLRQETLRHGCFFETRDAGLLPKRVGAVLGNPPFESKLQTPAIQRAYEAYQRDHGSFIPDKQAGYLFLHAASEIMAEGATISMVQQYNFLYNKRAQEFRRAYLNQYYVREILDFISVRGLFSKGNADTKIVVVVAQKKPRPGNASLLHVTFRRTGRIDAEQGLDLDYYDLHAVPYAVALTNDRVWRANILGGARALSLVDRLEQSRTLKEYAKERGWILGEGFIVGDQTNRRAAMHLTGKPYLLPSGLTERGIDTSKIVTQDETLFRTPYDERRFTAPMLLIREHMDLEHGLWTKGYLTYSQRMVGLSAAAAEDDSTRGTKTQRAKQELEALQSVDKWMSGEKRTLRAYLQLVSPGLFIQKATALQASDIYAIPFPASGSFDLSENEQIIVDDILDYQAEMVRLGEKSKALQRVDGQQLEAYHRLFAKQIAGVYSGQKFDYVDEFVWAGAVCQAYAFGDAKVDWSGAKDLQKHVERLLRRQSGQHVSMTRICRLYEGSFVFILKPDRLRYWTRSIALRDADDVLADLRAQGF